MINSGEIDKSTNNLNDKKSHSNKIHDENVHLLQESGVDDDDDDDDFETYYDGSDDESALIIGTFTSNSTPSALTSEGHQTESEGISDDDEDRDEIETKSGEDEESHNEQSFDVDEIQEVYSVDIKTKQDELMERVTDEFDGNQADLDGDVPVKEVVLLFEDEKKEENQLQKTALETRDNNYLPQSDIENKTQFDKNLSENINESEPTLLEEILNESISNDQSFIGCGNHEEIQNDSNFENEIHKNSLCNQSDEKNNVEMLLLCDGKDNDLHKNECCSEVKASEELKTSQNKENSSNECNKIAEKPETENSRSAIVTPLLNFLDDLDDLSVETEDENPLDLSAPIPVESKSTKTNYQVTDVESDTKGHAKFDPNLSSEHTEEEQKAFRKMAFKSDDKWVPKPHVHFDQGQNPEHSEQEHQRFKKSSVPHQTKWVPNEKNEARVKYGVKQSAQDYKQSENTNALAINSNHDSFENKSRRSTKLMREKLHVLQKQGDMLMSSTPGRSRKSNIPSFKIRVPSPKARRSTSSIRNESSRTQTINSASTSASSVHERLYKQARYKQQDQQQRLRARDQQQQKLTKIIRSTTPVCDVSRSRALDLYERGMQAKVALERRRLIARDARSEISDSTFSYGLRSNGMRSESMPRPRRSITPGRNRALISNAKPKNETAFDRLYELSKRKRRSESGLSSEPKINKPQVKTPTNKNEKIDRLYDEAKRKYQKKKLLLNKSNDKKVDFHKDSTTFKYCKIESNKFDDEPPISSLTLSNGADVSILKIGDSASQTKESAGHEKFDNFETGNENNNVHTNKAQTRESSFHSEASILSLSSSNAATATVSVIGLGPSDLDHDTSIEFGSI